MDETGAAELVYFLHIPKTAGTSVHAFLARVTGESRVPHSLLWDHLTCGGAVVVKGVRLVSGHFGGLLPLWLGRWPRIVTFVRDPVGRALSHIHHVQRHDVHPLHRLAAGLSVADYCRHPELRNTIDNVQSRHLASLGFALALVPKPGEDRPWAAAQMAFESALLGLDAGVGLRDAATRAIDAIDVVGVTEEFGRSLRVFAAALGYTGEVEEPRLNVTPEEQKARTRLTEADREALAGLTAIDAEVYRYARASFHELCDRFGVAPDPACRPAA